MTSSTQPRSDFDSTWWTMIGRAARGDEAARRAFAEQYPLLIRRTLAARWRGGALLQQLEDAVQDVFLDCFKEQGALVRVERGRRGGFRAFLHGITSNVARRYERAQGRQRDRANDLHPDLAVDAPSLSAAFDRAWLQRLLDLAVARMRALAQDEGAQKRVELLALRFGENLPIREIAPRWGCDAPQVHTAYARARREFRRALHEVMRANTTHGDLPGSDELDRRLRALLRA